MYDYECDEYNRCNECEEHEETLASIRPFFRGVLENVYGKNKLNLQDLERCLDEIAGYLGMKLPDGDLQVRGVVPTNHMLEEWKFANALYLKSLKHTQHVGV